MGEEKIGSITIPDYIVEVERDFDSFNDRCNPDLIRDAIHKMAISEGEESARVWNLLASTIKDSGYNPPQDRDITILDLGCGRCIEAFVLRTFFSGKSFGETGDKAHIIGIDIDEKAIKAAKIKNQRAKLVNGITTWTDDPEYTFIHGDATKPDTYPEVY